MSSNSNFARVFLNQDVEVSSPQPQPIDDIAGMRGAPWDDLPPRAGTQNFAPREHFPSVWPDVVEDRSVCASFSMRKQLSIHEPELLDELDGD